MIYGDWITSAINTASSTSITNTLDLGRVYDKICIQTGVTNGTPTLGVKAIRTAAGTASTLQAMNCNATGSADWITSATSANETFLCPIGPFRYVQLVYGSVAQTNTSVAYVCGFRD